MAVRTKIVLDEFSPRRNPFKMLGESQIAPRDLEKIARSIAKLERETYRDTEVEETGFHGMLDTLRDEDLKYSAVIYDTNSGGTELGPYIGYVLAYTINPSHEDFTDAFEYVDDVIDRASRQARRGGASEMEKVAKMRQDVSSIQKELIRTSSPVVYANDAVRQRTDFAKQELNSFWSELFKRLKDAGAYLMASCRAETSYKVIKRLEQQGILEIKLDVPDDDYFDDEIVHHVIVKF